MVDRAKRLIGEANRRRTVGSAALIISGAYLLSRLAHRGNGASAQPLDNGRREVN